MMLLFYINIYWDIGNTIVMEICFFLLNSLGRENTFMISLLETSELALCLSGAISDKGVSNVGLLLNIRRSSLRLLLAFVSFVKILFKL